MGEIAELIVEGVVCQYCMLPFEDNGEGCGYPRTCEDCMEGIKEEDDEK